MFVSNTSTLVLIAKVDLLDMFLANVGRIDIPKQVHLEAIFKEGSYDALRIAKAVQKGQIRVQQVDETKVGMIKSNFRLGEGEAAAYVLFDPKKHKAILTDDGEMIKLCRLENKPFVCALAVVVRLMEKKVISKEEALEKALGI